MGVLVRHVLWMSLPTCIAYMAQLYKAKRISTPSPQLKPESQHLGPGQPVQLRRPRTYKSRVPVASVGKVTVSIDRSNNRIS